MNAIVEAQIDWGKMNKDELYNSEMGKVWKTNVYSKFKIIGGNRVLNILHAKRLAKSMKKKYLAIPIIVNSDYEVIDGQHRLFNAITMGLPVYYIMLEDYGLKEVQQLNQNTSNWSMSDFMEGYAGLGMTDYVKYAAYKKKYGFNHQIMRSMLTGDSKQKTSEEFKEGRFVIVNEHEFLEIARKLIQLGDFYDGYKRRGFISSMLALFRNDKFVFETFLSKLAFQRTKLVDCTSSKEYLLIIEDIYNFKSATPISLRFSR